MTNIEELVQPVSGEKPSGEDFTYHDAFLDLERAAKGKPADQFSEGEEPDWKEVREKATEVLRQSKHLRAAVLLTLSLIKLEQSEGLRDGLAVVRRITEGFWPDAYPSLDATDNNDPTERLNTLNELSGGKFGAHIRQMVLCQSPTLGRITLDQYVVAKETDRPGGGGPPRAKDAGPDLNQINAALQDANPDAVKSTFASADEALGHAEALEKFIDDKLGAGNGVNFESLTGLLKKMKEAVGPFAGNGAPAGENTAAGEADAAAAAGGSGDNAGGGGRRASADSIESGADVVRYLDKICDYYARNEPSSPVPLILRRAKNLVDKDFTSIMTNLTPDALSQLRVITGKEDQ